MKKEEVPQDHGFLKEGKIRDLCYALDENGNYTQIYSVGWDPKNEAMKQAWDDVYETAFPVAKEVLDGKKSPLAFYAEVNLMDIKMVAQYMELPKRKVRRHMNPKVFETLDRKLLEKYADVFNISIEQLSDTQLIKEFVERNNED